MCNRSIHTAITELVGRRKEGISALLSGILVLVYVYTSLDKVIDHERFLNALRLSVLLQKYAVWIALFLPLAELAVTVMLVVPQWRSYGYRASTGLLLILTTYLGWMVATVGDLPCNCGGVIEQMSWPAHIVFNLMLIIVSIVGMKVLD